jgi:Golgi nucleoside diphosphatase
MDNPDVHLSLFSVAKNLLLHKNGFSILASFVCTGNIFVTDEFSAASQQNWLRDVNVKKVVLLK